jgi:predicted O-methyltransferase YrrM
MEPQFKVLSEIENYAYSRGLPIIGPERGKILSQTVMRLKPKCVLELGTLVGYSTILIGREMDRGSSIFTVEIDYDEVVFAKNKVGQVNLKPELEFYVGFAHEIIPKLNVCFDFVFMDAEHGEFRLYLRLLEDGNKIKRGAVIFADNAGFYSNLMKDYLSYVRTSGLFKSRYIPVGSDGVEISEKL